MGVDRLSTRRTPFVSDGLVLGAALGVFLQLAALLAAAPTPNVLPSLLNKNDPEKAVNDPN